MPNKPMVFVSCGQYTAAEKELGRGICALVREFRNDVEPYFAENQSTVDGLSNHILKNLHRCAGLICVMHKRGDINTPENRPVTRGSVWIEQEIAIAAFIRDALNRSFPVFFYKQAGVGVEGVRSVLLMNARIEFKEEGEVLEDLKKVLPVAEFNPFMDYEVELLLQREPKKRTGEHHEYVLVSRPEERRQAKGY